MSRLDVVVSKRAPVTFRLDENTGRVELEAPMGGPTNVLGEMSRLLHAPWIASAMSGGDHDVARRHPDGLRLDTGGQGEIDVHLIEHATPVFDAVQNSLSSSLLWAALHGIWDTWSEPTFDNGTREAWRALQDFTADFAVRVARVAAKHANSRIFVHDYQFTCLPPRLRDELPDASICVALHTAWPSADRWSVLPRYMREGMLRGLLDADVVVVLARRWARNIAECASLLLDARAELTATGYEIETASRRTRIAVLPLGYSEPMLKTAHFPDEHAGWVGDRPLVVHYGRTDPIKNAPRAIQAFRMAASSDATVRQARLLVRALPHHLYQPVNQRYLDQLTREAAQANQELGDDAVRIVLANDIPATLGAYGRADVLIANSVVDGQLLGPFEAAMVNDRGLQLVLTENCGAAEVLGSNALLVNPFDIAEQAESICRAVTAPRQERVAGAARLRADARPHTWESWVKAQVELLN